jgi:hypothetical protein
VSSERKRCGRCGERLPLEAFNRMGAGHQHWCRECFREYFRARGERHRRQSGAARAWRVARARAFVAAHLEGNPCVDCGERDLRVLDFDHVRDKVACISELAARGAPRARLEEEMAKCEVRCANCHRRVTARRAGWSRLAGDVDDPRRAMAAPVRRNLNHVHAVLAAGACVDCGEQDMLTLEFDHLGDKAGQISTMVWNVGLATLIAEIAKCELRCCNCHRRVTYERRAARAGQELQSGARPP